MTATILNYATSQILQCEIPDDMQTTTEIEMYLHTQHNLRESDISYMITDDIPEIEQLL